MLGWGAELNPAGFDVLMNAFIREKENSIEISLAVGLRSKTPPPPGGARGTSAPPTAYRIGIDKFWRTYEAELPTVVANRAASAKPPSTANEQQSESGHHTEKAQPSAAPTPPSPKQSSVASGTGFVVDHRGHILTNCVLPVTLLDICH